MRIGTHNGTFHADEALGCFLLRRLPKFQGAEIVRTRDEKTLEPLEVVLDVGGVYDPPRHRFDHHQKGFDEVFGHGFATKLSSAGMIYKHFGKELIAQEMGLEVTDPTVTVVWLAVYKQFMEAIDGIDNGINQYGDAVAKYKSQTNLSARVSFLNPQWNEDASEPKQFEAFEKAMALTVGSRGHGCPAER